MHILLIEFALTGHHAGYLERVAMTYLHLGNHVTITVLGRELHHPSIDRLTAAFPDIFQVVVIDETEYSAAWNSRWGDAGREVALRRIIGQAYRLIQQTKPIDYVFLPYLDYCLYAIGLIGSPFGSTPWGGICMRPSFHYDKYEVAAPRPRFARVKRMLFLRLLGHVTLKCVFTIDQLLCQFIAEGYPALKGRVRYLADPAELHGNDTLETARHALTIPANAVVVLVYGAIDERKGLDALLAAIEHPDTPRDIHLLLVGRQSASIRALVDGHQFANLLEEGRCHVVNEFVDHAVEQRAFAAADVVWLGYRRHYGMSGVLVLAALSGVPVIATRDGLIGWFTRTQRLGASVSTTDSAQVASALREVVAIRGRPKRPNDMIRASHSWDAFSRAVSSSHL
jgi:glycosyltransferase involved in cell wall biosynthesis